MLGPLCQSSVFVIFKSFSSLSSFVYIFFSFFSFFLLKHYLLCLFVLCAF